MNILVITDLYPVRENEKNTPKTIKNFVECWQKEGHEVQVIKPNFLLNSFDGLYSASIGYFDELLNQHRIKFSTLLFAYLYQFAQEFYS